MKKHVSTIALGLSLALGLGVAIAQAQTTTNGTGAMAPTVHKENRGVTGQDRNPNSTDNLTKSRDPALLDSQGTSSGNGKGGGQ